MTIGSTVALGVGILATAAVVAIGIEMRVRAQAGTAPVSESDVRGLHVRAEVRLGALPPQSTYWHIYEFDSHAVAEAARPGRGIVAEAFGRHWLYGSE
jgi:hypothetical protein